VSPAPTVENGTIDTDPNAFVSGSCYLIETNWDKTPATGTTVSGVSGWPACGGASGAEPLVVGTGSPLVAPLVTPSQTIQNGSLTYTVDEYVTDTNIGCNPSVTGASNCYNPTAPGTACTTTCWSPLGDAKRVTVAVVMSNGGTNNAGSSANARIGQNSPVYVSTIFTNPVPSNQSNSSIGLSLGLNLG
jgi:hypothetical protein